MACYKPITAYQSTFSDLRTKKKRIEFKSHYENKKGYERIMLPCNQCIGCRVQRSKNWALRCMHESMMWQDNCFITLTYKDETLPMDGSLCPRDFTLFMKRLRKKYNGSKKDSRGQYPIRYFQCGEYGTLFKRPHHHACLFNFDFPDKQLWSIKRDVKLYRSPSLEKLWPHGYSTIGEVTYESAAYVARYITKKINGEKKFEHYQFGDIDKDTGEVGFLRPEYITMSRRPGIGATWFHAFGKSDCYPKDYVTMSGKKFKVPSYYDKLYDDVCPDDMQQIKFERVKRIQEIDPNELSPKRLAVKKRCAERAHEIRERKYENETTML